MTVRQFQVIENGKSFPVVIDKLQNGAYVAIECKTRGEGGNRQINWAFSLDWLIETAKMEYSGSKIIDIF